MIIKVTELNWIFTLWWQNATIGLIVFGFISFYVSYLTTPNMMERLDYSYVVWQELPFSLLALLDFYKDIIYVRRFPHSSSMIIFALYFSITGPFAMLYIF